MGLASRIDRFLVRDEQERDWTLEMHERLRPVTAKGGVIMTAMAVAIVPWTHAVALLPMLLGGVVMALSIAVAGARRDVRPIFFAILLTQVLLGVAILVNGRAHVGDLFLLTLGVVPAAGGFPDRLVTAIACWCGTIMVATAMAVDPGAVLASPPTLILPLGALASIAILSTAVRRASMEDREAARVDGLTGCLNRPSLDARAAELAAQTAVTGEPVAVVALDVDRFKLVNDLFGHQAGDRVLIALAGLLRTHGQAFRLGGDEFVLVLPGADAAQAAEIAERVAETVRSAPLADVPVTVSVGVAASLPGTTFAWSDVHEGADTALYRAKRAGRDAVEVSAGRMHQHA